MADDQNIKTMDINDLVRELSKSSTNPVVPTPPLAPSSQAPRPSFPTPKPLMPPPMASPLPKPFVPPAPPNPPLPKQEMPRPQFSVPPQSLNQSMSGQVKPAPTPTPATPTPATPGVKEYQSSIRTMNEDISKIRQGQQPMGVPIPRKVEQATPVPQPVAPKPSMPSQQFKVPSINLGETQKTGPMAQTKDISRPATTPKIEPKPEIYIPEGGPKGGNRNMLFLGIGALAVVAGFAYWFFVLRAPAPEIVIETPTPTATPVPTPTPTLLSMFSGVQKESISIKSENPLPSFVTDIFTNVVVDSGGLRVVEAVDIQTPSLSYGFSDLLVKLKLNIPSELLNNLGADSAVFIYGQKELFDSKGQIRTGAMPERRVVLVGEVKDSLVASQSGKNWELKMPTDLSVILQLDTKKQMSVDFADNSYRGAGIRFNNYPYADKSIDYTVITATNGKSYIVIGNSREAVYLVIDKLKGF